ncbi:MAG: hypothetical protein J3R72DRAFT_428464 [Linnemannia gamsii]|nr:MAG: hypothetical protein J3R72DRAFT_428464 [Linnemannia gamsii]
MYLLEEHPWQHSRIFNPILWRNVYNYLDSGNYNSLLPGAASTGSLKKYGRHVQHLKLDGLIKEFEEFLALAPRRFSRLQSIELTGRVDSDEMIADLLWRCSRRHGGVGLRRLVFDLDGCVGGGAYFAFGEESVEALLEHISTLEVFCVEVFGCPIGGIPRPDIDLEIHDGPVSELILKGRHRKSLTLHRRVYSQLARLTNPRELRMGIPYDTEGDLYHWYDKESDRQYDCLAMSLESGLDLLRGRKSLQVVALQDMEVGIYEKGETKWVAQHWPKAKVAITDPGTDRDDDSM